MQAAAGFGADCDCSEDSEVLEPADLPAMKWFAPPASKMRWDEWHVACSIALARSDASTAN